MTENDTTFDLDRVEELTQKAEQNDLTDEEIAELREQKDALMDASQSVVDAIIPAMRQLAEVMEPVVSAFADLNEATEPQRRRQEEIEKMNKCDDRTRHHLQAARKRMREREADGSTDQD